MWRGKLLPTDLLWQEGMDAGQPAHSFAGLFPSATPATPGLEASLPRSSPAARRTLERPLVGGLALLGAALTFTPW